MFSWLSLLRSDRGFNPSWVLDPTPGAVGGALVERLVTGMQSLDIAANLSEGDFGPAMFMLSNAIHLISLSLHRLTTLKIPLDQPVCLDYVCTQWRMPKLTSLTMAGCSTIPVKFLQAHGAKLTYLHFDEGSWIESDTTSKLVDGVDLLPRLHELCPVLEHLALLIPKAAYPALLLNSPTLRYLDVVLGTFPAIEQYRSLSLAEGAVAPELQSVRFVMLSEKTPDVPQVCHPSLLLPDGNGPFTNFPHVPPPPYDKITSDDDAASDVDTVENQRKKDVPEAIEFTTGGILYEFPLARVRQMSWIVVHEPQVDGFMHLIPESHPLFDDSELGWCSESGMISGEEESDLDVEVLNVDGPYDRDTVLRMFRAGLENDYLLD
ncbi:hypothetical protein C8T65DRAFT_745492 [Cerioporus squamosus]|nr:hypothetical protein C8T65DRAFT_745492 [Cerioporus squamosus]